MNAYKVSLKIERFNDGKYRAEVSVGGSVQTSGYSTREELFNALDTFKQRLVDYETKLDGE